MTIDGSASGVPVLGRLELVEPREVWTHEARSFTPWLLENADALGEVLGMDLALSGAEHSVGGFSLDLIGVDESSNERVIIENQLEGTDHAHLGQLLTYAGGTDPANIVWIATRFREEHRAALDWLNNRTDESTRFFGVELGVVRIGNSDPAPRLQLVVQPNDWGKKVKATARAETTSRAAAYLAFWTRFLEHLAVERRGWTKTRKAAPQNWQTLPAGSTGVGYTCYFSKSGLCSEIVFADPDPAVNDARLAAAASKRDALEAAYGARLSFEPLHGKKSCRIADYHPGSVEQTEDWDSYITWFVDAQTRLRKAIATIGGLGALNPQSSSPGMAGDPASRKS